MFNPNYEWNALDGALCMALALQKPGDPAENTRVTINALCARRFRVQDRELPVDLEALLMLPNLAEVVKEVTDNFHKLLQRASGSSSK